MHIKCLIISVRNEHDIWSMEKWHLLWISLLTSTYLLAWNIQMKEIQIRNNEKTTKVNIVEGNFFCVFHYFCFCQSIINIKGGKFVIAFIQSIMQLFLLYKAIFLHGWKMRQNQNILLFEILDAFTYLHQRNIYDEVRNLLRLPLYSFFPLYS